MPIETPFAQYEGEVLPAWIDSNGHMNLAYYVVLFDYGTDAIFEALGFGHAYRIASNCGSFAVESHTLYERELLLGERVLIRSLVLGADTKRMHLAHEMIRLADGSRAAMQELMYLHVDLSVRRVAPFPHELRDRLAEAAATHAAVGRPDWVGRRIALPS
jgi:acyl-CoA thioester hydrolase